jgi:YbgC/YbaW family acyl-CoA thioester hydrolase
LTEECAPGFLAVRTQVRWGDCDPAGIAFFPRFFEWMDLASHALAQEMGISRQQTLGPASYGFPAVHAQAEFLRPVLLHDALEIRTTVPRIGRTTCTCAMKWFGSRTALCWPVGRRSACTFAANAVVSERWCRIHSRSERGRC